MRSIVKRSQSVALNIPNTLSKQTYYGISSAWTAGITAFTGNFLYHGTVCHFSALSFHSVNVPDSPSLPSTVKRTAFAVASSTLPGVEPAGASAPKWFKYVDCHDPISNFP